MSNNIVANFTGKAFAALSVFIFVPIYLRYLGAEAYGLIGFYTTIQTIAFLADIGLSGAFTRKCAQISNQKQFADELRDLGKTFEVLFVAIGLFLSGAIVLLSGKISSHWINSTALSGSSIMIAIGLMGLATGLQFPFFVYQGGLLGLQRQVSMNVLLIATGLLRGVGAVVLLVYVSPTITVFFLWQALVSVLQTLAGRMLLWRIMPAGTRPAMVRPELVKQLWRFAAGMAGISITSIILTQADKVILSRVLSLENFGYYSLAVLVAGIPYLLAWPINTAAYPKFTQMVAGEKTKDLISLYHAIAQLTALVTLPVGAMLLIYPHQIMQIWTGNLQTAAVTADLVRLLAIGSSALALMYVPFALQLAYGWTRLTFSVNLIASAIMIPAAIVLSSRFGMAGVCILWTVMNVSTAAATIFIMHRRLLSGECWTWCRSDVLLPALLAVSAVALTRVVMPPGMAPVKTVLYLVSSWAASAITVLLGTPRLHQIAGSQLARRIRNQDKEL